MDSKEFNELITRRNRTLVMPIRSGEMTQAPNPHLARTFDGEGCRGAVICSYLEELMFGAVPLIQNFLHEILVIVQLEAKWSLVCFATGVTLNLQPHTKSVS